MRKDQIKVGNSYNVKIDGVELVVTVRSIRPTGDNIDGATGTGYDCTVMKTDGTPAKMVGRKVTFESAAKFRSEYVKPEKPKLKHPTVPGIGKKPEGEKSSDPTSVVTVERGGTISNAVRSGAGSSDDCLGYDPSLATGRCRCANCKSKPLSERATRPFVNAADAAPTIPIQTPTSGSASSSSPPDPKQTVTTRADGVKKGSVFGAMANQPIVTDTAPHLVIEARAGTGKTTTLIEALKLLKGYGTHLTPSPEQRVIWDAILESKDKINTIGFVAFNRSIADELKRRVPNGVDAMTMHSLGFRAINQAVQLWGGNRSVDSYRTSSLLERELKTDSKKLRQDKLMMVRAVEELVGLCKVNLIGYRWEGQRMSDGSAPRPVFVPDSIDEDELDQLVDYFDIDLDGTSRAEVYPLVVRILQRCLDVEDDRCIDYDDMIWLPIVRGFPIPRYDLLLVDEAQDLNRCQQAMAKLAGERIIMVGDPKQAIYGFAGADCESMSRMAKELTVYDRGCRVLPLTVTRRCGKAIVQEANKIVPDFFAHESNGPGTISRMVFDSKLPNSYHTKAADGDMVLCRVNAPLVSECFRFIKAGRKANIQGRDVGKGLVKLIQKLRATDVKELIQKLETWMNNEIEKESCKKHASEARVIAIQDKHDCISCFIDGVALNASPSLVVEKIEAVFTDNKQAPGIRLSSIHKAKGLEAERVFLLEPEGATVPHPMAKTPWQREQEMNLKYVAVTRAIKELVFVS